MVTVQDLVDSSTRDDLVDQADDLGITDKREDGSKKSKAELAEDILAAETEVAEPEDSGADDEPDEVVEEESDDPDEAEVSDEELLVRFSGPNPTLQVEGFSFSSKNPFKVVTEDDFQRLVDSRYGYKFRRATPREAKEFYS